MKEEISFCVHQVEEILESVFENGYELKDDTKVAMIHSGDFDVIMDMLQRITKAIGEE